VTPYASFIALDVVPQQAYANIQKLRALYPGLYGVDGFFDAVDPTTGAVGHRYLVLDQSMIMAALDNAISNRAIQRDFARPGVLGGAHVSGAGNHVAGQVSRPGQGLRAGAVTTGRQDRPPRPGPPPAGSART
jgi:hypothetical protein